MTGIVAITDVAVGDGGRGGAAGAGTPVVGSCFWRCREAKVDDCTCGTPFSMIGGCLDERTIAVSVRGGE